MRDWTRHITIIVLFLFSLSGCSLKSEDKVMDDTAEIVKQTFKDAATIQANNDVNSNPIYIPSHLEIESGDKTNLILKEADQTYIVFHNTIENSRSELNFQAAKTSDALVLESFSDNEKFGYIRVLPDEGKGYELQIGIGGVKITTYTTKAKLEKDAEELMKMAKFLVQDD